MFQPCKGSKYDVTRLLILGESPFSWWEDDELRHPLPQHFIEMFKWAIDSFPDCGRFFAMVSRGLANEENPSKERLKFVWDRAAFTNYVSGTVGDGSRVRPIPTMWDEAKQDFLPAVFSADEIKQILAFYQSPGRTQDRDPIAPAHAAERDHASILGTAGRSTCSRAHSRSGKAEG